MARRAPARFTGAPTRIARSCGGVMVIGSREMAAFSL
jgi:hypothetical protein